jgi:hypothetical protein
VSTELNRRLATLRAALGFLQLALRAPELQLLTCARAGASRRVPTMKFRAL